MKDLFTRNFAAITIQVERMGSESPEIAAMLKDVRSDLAWLDSEMAKLFPRPKGQPLIRFSLPRAGSK